MLGYSLLLDTSHIDTVEIASSSNKHWKEKEEKIETFFEIVCYQVQSTCIIYRCEDQMIIIRNIKTCRRSSIPYFNDCYSYLSAVFHANYSGK